MIYIVAHTSTPNFALNEKSFCHCLSTKNLLTVLFFSLSGSTSDKPLEKSITNSRNEQFQILALPAMLLFQMFCNFYSIAHVHMELTVLPKYGKIMSQK